MMKKTLSNIIYALLSSIMCFFFFSCEEKTVEEGTPSLIGFTEDTYVYSESDVFAYIPVELDHSQFSYIKSDLEFSVPDTSTHFGSGQEVYIQSSPPVLIYGGIKSAVVPVWIYNDRKVDGDDHVDIELVPTVGNVKVDPERYKTRFTIRDDDAVPANEMRIHVNWLPAVYLTFGRPFISSYEIDLFLLSDVVLDEDGIAEANVFKSSTNRDKYQDIVLLASDPDQEYYIKIVYESYDKTIADPAIIGKIKLNGFGYTDVIGGNVWSFEIEEDGYYLYLGPFKKQGATFVLQE